MADQEPTPEETPEHVDPSLPATTALLVSSHGRLERAINRLSERIVRVEEKLPNDLPVRLDRAEQSISSLEAVRGRASGLLWTALTAAASAIGGAAGVWILTRPGNGGGGAP